MDAVKFIEEHRRMYKVTGKHLPTLAEGIPAEDVVKEVEEWSAAHPRKTRQSVFLEQYPNAESDHQGIPIIDPCDVDKTMHGKDGDCYNGNCDDCRAKFWAQEVE